jgi:hypothetical protein
MTCVLTLVVSSVPCKHGFAVRAGRESRSTRGVRSLETLADTLSEAGYRPGKSGRLYGRKISGYINSNAGMPDEFLRWVDAVYGIEDEWLTRFSEALMKDALGRPDWRIR